MGHTIDLRALLDDHRAASAAYHEAKRKAEAATGEFDRRRTIARAEGRDLPAGEGEAVDRMWDDVNERYGTPEFVARNRLAAAVTLACGGDPYAKRFDRHRAFMIDGAVVVTIDREDDANLRPCIVVAPGDVLGLPEDIPHINDPKLRDDLEVESEPAPKPKRRRKAVKP